MQSVVNYTRGLDIARKESDAEANETTKMITTYFQMCADTMDRMEELTESMIAVVKSRKTSNVLKLVELLKPNLSRNQALYEYFKDKELKQR